MKIRTSYKTQPTVPTASRIFGQAELNHWPGMGSVVQACRGVLGWLPLLLLCVLLQAAYGQNETDSVPYNFLDFLVEEKEAPDYRWTTDHMHVGARWQPFVGRPENNAYDTTRPVIDTDSSYVQFKFVFIHHLVGGADRNNRGGIASAPFFEWGGKELDGTKTFAKHRPNWKLPIHDLLVKHDVSIVFHGHDHPYAKEEMDGIIYQAVPQPGHPRFGNVRSAEEYGYQGEVISSSGHLRISVSADTARVDYVRAYLPKDETVRRTNGEISASYIVK